MRKLLIIFVMFICNITFPDDIYSEDGRIEKNVKIQNYTTQRLVFKTTYDKIVTWKNPKVAGIENLPVRQGISSTINRCFGSLETARDIAHSSEQNLIPPQEIEYPNRILLPLSICAFLLSYETWDRGQSDNDDIQDLQNILNSQNSSENGRLLKEISELKSSRNKKYLVSALSFLVGALSLKISLKRVEIRTDNNKVSFGYKF